MSRPDALLVTVCSRGAKSKRAFGVCGLRVERNRADSLCHEWLDSRSLEWHKFARARTMTERGEEMMPMPQTQHAHRSIISLIAA